MEGSRVGVVPDATYTVHQLFQGMFLMSGNDAASALANADGGRRQTVARMNATAKGLGALDTTVRNPSGLDAPGQYTSAYDLALFARAGLARQDFRDYVTTVRARFPGKMPKHGKTRKTFAIYTQDRLLLNYRGAIGVKTGWTTKARGTFVGAATRNGHTLVATVLHTGFSSWKESRALLAWGFANLDEGPPGRHPQPGEAEDPGIARASKTPPCRRPTRCPPPPGAAGCPGGPGCRSALLIAVVALRTRVLLRHERPGGDPPRTRPRRATAGHLAAG